MDAENPPRFPAIPMSAACLALALLAAPFWPALLPWVAAAGGVAACALVLARRPSRKLRLALLGIASWLVIGLAGAWLLRGRPWAGLAWVLTVLYLVPLPLIPSLYWWTFRERGE